ncbi:MAG: glycosyltransferase [Symbiopectobacterium sp.]
MVLGEATVFVLPGIATNFEGIPEVIDDGRTGFLIDSKDYVELSMIQKTMWNYQKRYKFMLMMMH